MVIVWSHCLRWWVMPFIRWLNNLIIPCWFLGFVWDQFAGRNEWLSTILWYLQYFGNGGTAVFHWAGGIFWGPMAERIQWFIFGVGILQLNYWNIDWLIDGLIVYIYIYFNPNSLDWWLHELYTQYSASCQNTGCILGLRPANEGWRYFVTTSLIGWART